MIRNDRKIGQNHAICASKSSWLSLHVREGVVSWAIPKQLGNYSISNLEITEKKVDGSSSRWKSDSGAFVGS